MPMIDKLRHAAQQHLDGLTTAGELRLALAHIILSNEVDLNTIQDDSFTKLALQLNKI